MPSSRAASPRSSPAPGRQDRPGALSGGRLRTGTLWLLGELQPPLSLVVAAHARRHGAARTLVWLEPPPPEWGQAGSRRRARRPPEERRFGRVLTLRWAGESREYPLTVTWVSPRLLLALLRAPEDVVVVQELNLTGLFAVLSKLRPGRRVVVLAEGDLGLLGSTGRARLKVAFRRAVARFADAFVANGEGATRYLTQTVGVPRSRVVEGWWLAGLDGAAARGAGDPQPRAAGAGPVFLVAGQLIRRKGVDLLLAAVGRYRCEVGPCTLWVVGEGPERAALELQARELGGSGEVVFLGQVSHERLAELLLAADLLVFPTLHDLVGRVVAEALSVGTPVAVSRKSGAAGTLVRHGDNGLVMDPSDSDDLLGALRAVADPRRLAHLRAGAARTAPLLTPEAAAEAVTRGIEHARRGR